MEFEPVLCLFYFNIEKGFRENTSRCSARRGIIALSTLIFVGVVVNRMSMLTRIF